jgi:tetratricopeptide (TPR) repeat protein
MIDMSYGRAALAVVAATIMFATPSDAVAQPGALAYRIQFPLGTEERTSANDPLTWRVYTEPHEFQFKVSFTNESSEPVLIAQSRLRDVFAVGVDRGSEIAVRVEWLVSAADPVRIDPGKLASWTVTVSRADGQAFTAGLYSITRRFQDFRDAVSTIDGKAWGGRVPDGTGELAVIVKPGNTPAERALHHMLVAQAADAAGDFDAALESYERAAVEDPSDGQASLGMADMYLLHARYREALSLYQDLAARPGFARDRIAPFLAQAYVGAGDLASAVSVLQALGLSADEVSTALENMRRRVAENPPR